MAAEARRRGLSWGKRTAVKLHLGRRYSFVQVADIEYWGLRGKARFEFFGSRLMRAEFHPEDEGAFLTLVRRRTAIDLDALTPEDSGRSPYQTTLPSGVVLFAWPKASGGWYLGAEDPDINEELLRWDSDW
jgi:hypothetical protein